MLPELFKIPIINFTLNTYGLMLAISFIAGLALAARLAARDGYDKGKIYDMGLLMLIAVLIGSKVLMIIAEWESFVANPMRLFSLEFLRSAGVFYGGFLGAVVVSFYLAHHYKFSWWALADACAPGVALGQFFGRLGCFSAGCCWGKSTTSWLGVRFTERAHELTGVPIDALLHPTQLYESLATLILTASLIFLHSRRQFRGQVILVYAALYAITRFAIEFYRDDPRGNLWIFSTSQTIALFIAPLAIALLIYRWRQAKANVVNSQLSQQPS